MEPLPKLILPGGSTCFSTGEDGTKGSDATLPLKERPFSVLIIGVVCDSSGLKHGVVLLDIVSGFEGSILF